jgi:hypothetical protein
MEKTPDSSTRRALGPSNEAGLQEQVARLAHALWESRGCPMGSPESDWYGAEQPIRPKSPTVVVGRPLSRETAHEVGLPGRANVRIQ